MRGLILGLFVFLLASACNSPSAPAAEKPPGLTVRNKVLLLEGKPYRGIGVNYFSYFSRLIADPNDTSSLTNLVALSKAKIPFVRFMCGGFWPTEQRLYLTNREAFFERLDRVVRCAESNHVGLVPSLFWNLPTVPDLASEPMQELGNTNSRSIALIRDYTTEVVSRYRGSCAIWAWEFGNEGSLSADLPNAAEHRPPSVPELGTPKQRTSLDELKSSQLQVAFIEFARTVRRLDPERLVLSGNALPRASAWHNTHEGNWKPDDAEQFREVLRRDNPDPMNGISIHIYPGQSFPADATNLAQAVKLSALEAIAAGKPLFVGEFGVSRQAGPIENQKRIFGELLAAIENAHVPLAAAWVFDFPGQDQDWNITFENDRAFFLKMISETNQRIRSQP